MVYGMHLVYWITKQNSREGREGQGIDSLDGIEDCGEVEGVG